MKVSKGKGLGIIVCLLTFVATGAAQLKPPSPPTQPGFELIYRPRGKVVLFVMDGIGYRQVFSQGLSAFGDIGAWLERNGSVALLNTMGYGGTDRFRSAMTIACGVRAFADETAGMVREADEPMDADTALNAYRRHVGDAVLPDAPTPFKSLVFPMLSKLLRRNEQLQKKSLPFGVVAQSLWQRGIRIVGIGCSDVTKVANGKWRMANSWRHGLLPALNEHGVGIGLTNPTLLRKHSAMPFGIATDERRWREAIEVAWRFASVLVLFPGDTLRADLYGSERLMPKTMRYELNLLKPIVERLNLERDLLLVFSLAPSRHSRYEHSFVYAIGKGMVSGGLLTSATTHRNGIVSVVDIPATILDLFNVKPTQPIIGMPIRSVSHPALRPSPFALLFGIGESARINDSWWRFAVFVTWCVVQGIMFVLLAVVFLLQRPLSPIAIRWLLVFAALPFGLHVFSAGFNWWLQGIMPTRDLSLLIVFLLIGLFVIIGFGDLDGAQRRMMLIISFVFAIDGLKAGALSFNTPFGYSSFLGIRFYGLGNASMGLALGALFALGIVLERRWLAALLCAFGTILVGAPFWGANIGGALTGVVLTAAIIGAGRWRWWYLLLTILFAVLVLGSFSVYELVRPEPLTHWGRFLQTVSEEGFASFSAMVWRKVTISLRVFRSAYWDIAFAGMVLLMAALWIRYKRDWQVWALTLGSISALVFNDTGPQTPVAFAFLPLCVLAMKTMSVARTS